MAATQGPLSAGSDPTNDTATGSRGKAADSVAKRAVRSPGIGPPPSPALSLALEEMQREQEGHTRRVIFGSALALGCVVLVMLVVIVRLMFAEPTNKARPSAREYRVGAASRLPERGNASRYDTGVGEYEQDDRDTAWGNRRREETRA